MRKRYAGYPRFTFNELGDLDAETMWRIGVILFTTPETQRVGEKCRGKSRAVTVKIRGEKYHELVGNSLRADIAAKIRYRTNKEPTAFC